MTTDKDEHPENLKLTTPRRNVKKYVSPLSHRKTNFHSSIGNGRLSTTRKYKISKLPISSVKHRKLPKDHQIDNVHHDSTKTLEWMNSLVNRAKSVLEKLKEEDAQLQEELYEDSRRKELKRMHVQNILDKNYEDKMEYSSTVSSAVSDMEELSEEQDEQVGSSLEQDQLSENEEDDDDALVILTDSEVEENEVNNAELEEEQEGLEEELEQQQEEEHDEDLFGAASDDEDEIQDEGRNSIEAAELLLSSESEELYEQEQNINQDGYGDENADYNEQTPKNEYLEEDEVSQNDINMQSDEGSSILNDNGDVEKSIDDTNVPDEGISDEENMNNIQSPLDATLMVPGTEAGQQLSDSHTHLLTSDLQTLAKQALYGNEILDEGHEIDTENTYKVPVESMEIQPNPLSYDSHTVATDNIQYGDIGSEENESQEEMNESSQESSVKYEQPTDVFNYSVDHSEIPESPEPIAIEVESDSNLDESVSSEAYSQGYDVSDTNEESENNNQQPEEHNVGLGAQSIADMLATIPHNVANHFAGSDNDIEPVEDVNMGVDESEQAEDAQIDSLPQYTDKIYDIEHHLIPAEKEINDRLETTATHNTNMMNDLATEPEDETDEEKSVSSVPPEQNIPIEVDESDSNEENEEEIDISGESKVSHSPALDEIRNTQSSFLHENTSIYFTVDEGNDSLITDEIRDIRANILPDENDKYKVEISESVYASSQDNRSITSQGQRNTYSSPYGADPFSTNEDVDDVKALIKETLLSISNPKEQQPAQANCLETEIIEQRNPENIENEKEETPVAHTFENNGSVQHIPEEHPMNDVFSNAATIGESEIENAIPEDHDRIVNQNTALTGENLNRIPANGMLDLLANIAQNEDIANINSPALSHELIQTQVQENNEANSGTGFIRETIINDMSNSEQPIEVQQENLIDNTINVEDDSDIGMVTALQEIEGTNNISRPEYNLEQETDTDVQSQSRLNSPVFHILGTGHHNHLVQDAHDYPTPVESAASSSNPSEHELAAVDDPVENIGNNEISDANGPVESYENGEINESQEGGAFDHSDGHSDNFQIINNNIGIIENDQQLVTVDAPVDIEEEQPESEIENNPEISTSLENNIEVSEHNIANDDQVIVEEGELDNQDIVTAEGQIENNLEIVDLIDPEENAENDNSDNSNSEMLDSSDIESHGSEEKKSMMKKILTVPVNTFKYIAHNVQNITNVTENFVGILNAYPTENDQSLVTDDHHASDAVSDAENQETHPGILYSTSAHVENNSDNENKNDDIPMLDDTITIFKEDIFKIDRNDIPHNDDIPQTFFQQTSEQERDIASDNNDTEPATKLNTDAIAQPLPEYSHGYINDELSSDIRSDSDVGMDADVENDNNQHSNSISESQTEGANEDIEMQEDLKPFTTETTNDNQPQSHEFGNLFNDESNELLENNMANELIAHVGEVSADLESSSTAENSSSDNVVRIGIVGDQISDEETANENTANENIDDNIGLQTNNEIIHENIDNTEGSTVNMDIVPEDMPSENDVIGETNPIFQDIEVNMQDITSQAVANMITQMAAEPENEPNSHVMLSTVASIPSDDSEYYTTGNADEILGVDEPQDNHEVNTKHVNIILDHGEDITTDNNVEETKTEETAGIALDEEEEAHITPNETTLMNKVAVVADVSTEAKEDGEDNVNQQAVEGDVDIQEEDLNEQVTATADVDIENNDITDNETEDKDTENEHLIVESNDTEDKDDENVMQEETLENDVEKNVSDISEQVHKEGNSNDDTSKIIQIGLQPESSNETGDQTGSEVDVKISEDDQNTNEISVLLENEEPQERDVAPEVKEENEEIPKSDTPVQQESDQLSQEIKNDTTGVQAEDIQSPKKKNKRRTRNLRKRKRAITGDSGSDGPSKRTRRGALQKKNNFDRKAKRNSRK